MCNDNNNSKKLRKNYERKKENKQKVKWIYRLIFPFVFIPIFLLSYSLLNCIPYKVRDYEKWTNGRKNKKFPRKNKNEIYSNRNSRAVCSPLGEKHLSRTAEKKNETQHVRRNCLKRNKLYVAFIHHHHCNIHVWESFKCP